jgi:hypothetical protein
MNIRKPLKSIRTPLKNNITHSKVTGALLPRTGGFPLGRKI